MSAAESSLRGRLAATKQQRLSGRVGKIPASKVASEPTIWEADTDMASNASTLVDVGVDGINYDVTTSTDDVSCDGKMSQAEIILRKRLMERTGVAAAAAAARPAATTGVDGHEKCMSTSQRVNESAEDVASRLRQKLSETRQMKKGI